MISNLIPVIGVLFLGWSVYFIMILFWLENVIIGSFNVLKMLTARGGILPGGLGVSDAVVAIASHARWLLIPFFIIHYGGFALVHGFFVWMLFRPGGFFGGSSVEGETRLEHLFIPLLALIISHALSFYVNFIKAGEDETSAPQLMADPYSRVVVLHVTIILGGILRSRPGGINGTGTFKSGG